MTALRSRVRDRMLRQWAQVGTRYLPFADAASNEFGLGRMLRLSLFQCTVGMALVLLNGTLNRILIVEMGASASVVALLVSLPLLFAPFRALLGHKSDHYQSALGWRRVPYIWMGTLLQFGGLAILPFSLILLSGDTHGPVWISYAGATFAFLLVGAGMHTVQTAGLALATDLAPEDKRPRVVCLLYVMLLLGMVVSSLVFGALLTDYQPVKLIRVLQGAGLLTLVVNCTALWKQEARNPARCGQHEPAPAFEESWADYRRQPGVVRSLLAVAIGTSAFSMQDILLEPYGGEVLGLPVSATTSLTALTAFGTLVAFSLAARWLERRTDPWRVAASGVLAGIVAFALVILSAPLASPWLFRVGAFAIGFGGGLFGLGSLTAAMANRDRADSGIALGAWGAVQATAAGVAVACGAGLKDVVAHWVHEGVLGAAMQGKDSAYGVVYHVEIALLFTVLVVIGPLVRRARAGQPSKKATFGLAEFPG